MQRTREDYLGALVRDHLLSPSQELKTMEWRFFVILVLSGLFHFTSSLLHRRYQLINEPKTWLEAQQYCRDNFTDLATINNEDDLDELSDLIGSGVSYVFLGLYRSWGWSLSDADDYKAGEETFWNWASGEPLEKQHRCGSINKTGEWYETDCSSKLNFSCYDESKAVPSERFSLGNSTMDWFSAQSYCRRRHTDLARVRNRLENEELQGMVWEDRVWIGLTVESWVWSDGSEASFTPWGSWEPSSTTLDDCAVLKVISDPLVMIAGECATKRPFFCYIDTMMNRVVAVKLTSNSSVDTTSVSMTDPAVLESILISVEKKLSDNGVTEDIKLKWRKLPELQEPIEEPMGLDAVVCVP